MSETKSNLKLLPQGAFLIQKEDEQVIKGRFSMYVLDRFCVEKGIESYVVLLDRIIAGMTVGDYGDLILMAIQDYYRANPDNCGMKRADVFDMIDKYLDGISSDDFEDLMRHGIGRVGNIKKMEDAAKKLSPEQETEKKSELKEDSNDIHSNNELTNAG
jgi:hypothetical protein